MFFYLSTRKFGGPTRIRTGISLLKRQDSSALELSALRAIIMAVERLKSHNNSDCGGLGRNRTGVSLLKRQDSNLLSYQPEWS
jgi:hypothetical protein